LHVKIIYVTDKVLYPSTTLFVITVRIMQQNVTDLRLYPSVFSKGSVWMVSTVSSVWN